MNEKSPIKSSTANSYEKAAHSLFSEEEIKMSADFAQEKYYGVDVDKRVLLAIAKSIQKHLAHDNKLTFSQAHNYALKEQLAQFGNSVSREAYVAAIGNLFGKQNSIKITTTSKSKKPLSEMAKEYIRARDGEYD